MLSKVLYNWSQAQRLSDFKVEGRGELQISADDGALLIRTYDCGPLKRATTVWLKDLELPKEFEVEWEYRSNSANGNTMILFNALPLGLKHLFEDPRADALYCDLAGYGKLVCHTIGFHRSPYGKPSVFRKIGGRVPAEWGQMTWPDPLDFEEKTTLVSALEPIAPGEKGKPQKFRLSRKEGGAEFFVNGTRLHAWTDHGQYPFYPEPIYGGRMGFRNFTGFADDYYTSLVVRKF